MTENVHTEPLDVHNRLDEMGLEQEALVNVVRQGYYAFIACTENDAPLYPGLAAWNQMVRALREYLLPKGWIRSNDNSFPLVINPSGTMAIAVSSSDELTGRQEASPSTKSSKGPRTIEVVAANQEQLNLFGHRPSPIQAETTDANSSDNRMTWYLLFHRALDEMRCELSLPLSMGNDGRIVDWQERIILGAIPTDPESLELTPPAPPQPDIDVAIKRRA
jgi:hypothetical protein